MPELVTQNGAGADRPVVTRLAPSPTGLLHLGHARSFLLAWWFARAAGGRVVLRIDDLDGERADRSLGDAAMRDLEWLGLGWDGPTHWQSEHVQAVRAAAQQLLDAGRAYPCVCSRGDIRRAQSAPQQGDVELRYPGTCRERHPTLEAAERSGQLAGLRFRTPAGSTTFVDELSGEHEYDVEAEIGDFLVLRRTKVPAYQLSVVVDDAAQSVTDVVRGDDLLPSTARQLLLQRALGLEHPRWWHVPLVLDETGRRLAKRHDALSLAELRDRRVDPRAIVSWAARASGFDVPERVEASEVIGLFDWAALPKVAVSITATTLDALGR